MVLSHEEADKILAHRRGVRGKDKRLHNITPLSLHTGMRAGEIFSLTWADINQGKGEITIRDPKAGKTRKAYMPPEIKAMFEAFTRGEPSELVFKDRRHGGRIKEISHAFRVAIDELKLNDGIKDPRQKVVFHTCRHSFASWLVEAGADPFTVMALISARSRLWNRMQKLWRSREALDYFPFLPYILCIDNISRRLICRRQYRNGATVKG